VRPDQDLSDVLIVPDDSAVVLVVGSDAFVEWDSREEQARRAQRQTYTVRRGDTLGRIARRFGVSTRDLMRLNNITDPDSVRAGRTLRVR
ncbi:MAG: LysM peptidoglycan-binding domain-containing protein, partial [Myxococcales bacterium]|nr:LysM peptidoglycan-binding domain-containing protein [Myxococcales bacterium]